MCACSFHIIKKKLSQLLSKGCGNLNTALTKIHKLEELKFEFANKSIKICIANDVFNLFSTLCNIRY